MTLLNDSTNVLSRRRMLQGTLASCLAGPLTSCTDRIVADLGMTAEVAILRADRYDDALLALIEAGFALVPPPDVQGKTVLLKPNLVDLPRDGKPIVTHPAVVAAAAEAFRRRGAERVIVADGPALQRDAVQIVDAIGLTTVLNEHGLPFVDLATDSVERLDVVDGFTTNPHLYFARTAVAADVIVSMPKMKTHHWAGASLALKNMYGTTSAMVYGWPRNRFHLQQLHPAVLDINRTLPADYAIVDGVVGLEGDGPVLGTPIETGVLVMGANLTAVDATAARIMQINPYRVTYLAAAAGLLGPLAEANITQRAERMESVTRPYALLPHLAHLRVGANTRSERTTEVSPVF